MFNRTANMSKTRDRVRRLLADELGECCEGDVQERLETLRALDETTATVERDSDLLGTLGNETRLGLVRWLDAAERELCVCELEALADVSESAVSHALSDLAAVGLVTRKKRGKWRYYGATDRAAALLATLDETRPDGEADRMGSDREDEEK